MRDRTRDGTMRPFVLWINKSQYHNFKNLCKKKNISVSENLRRLINCELFENIFDQKEGK